VVGSSVGAEGSCSLISATIDWGDGTGTSDGTSDGTTGIDGTQTYARFRTADGTVNYTCRTGNLPVMATAAFQVTVRDAPIHDTGRAVSATAGQSFSAVVAHVTDDNPGGVAADLSASVAGGDGTTSEAAVAVASGGRASM
jgi:hypothetical protein